MTITCAILEKDQSMINTLQKYIEQTPFLTLCGVYTNPMEALSKYYEQQIQLFFIGIENDEMNGCQFCQLLNNSTRVIFISSDKEYAADCFRLDALDYLLSNFTYPIFLDATNKALRWFNNKKSTILNLPEKEKEKKPFVYIKSEYKVVRLDLFRINYIESLGDYIKIYCTGEVKPILSLCSMKSIEEVLPEDDFIRVHRSYIVRKERIIEIKKGHIVFNSVNIPIGDSYRKKFQNYIDNLPIL